LKVKEKAGMRGVWPELKYRGLWLHDGKPLATYGIDHAATLEMTWRLLGGGLLTPARAPNIGAESNHAAANTVVPFDENNAAEPGPRARSVSPSVALADVNEKGMVPHNMEASNVARQAPAFEIAAANGATALDASIAAESAGLDSAHPPLLSRTHTHKRQVGHPRFGFRRK
jgi:hypothetical protein